MLKGLLRESEVNGFLADCEGVEGFEFAERVLDCFNCSYAAVGREIDRIPSEGGVLIRLNRAPGLAEAALLLKLVGEVRRDVRIVANDGLRPFTGLRPLLLPPQALRAALERDEAVIAGGHIPGDQGGSAALLPVHIGHRHWARFYGLSAFFRRGATLRIRISELVAPLANPGGKVLGFRTETPIARPEDRLLLRRELQEAQLVGHTGDGKKICLLDARADSAVLRELGRLREIAFRRVGEGTGKRRDMDAFDAYYRHVVLWDDAELQIHGAYRIGEAARILEERGPEGLYTHRLFSYRDGLRACLPEALEMGRSFVQPRYQGLRALDYLWQGIGGYLVTRPEIRYLFGPASLSAAYPEAARRMLVYFFALHFGAHAAMAEPRLPYVIAPGERPFLERLFPGADYPTELRTLKRHLSAMGVQVPALYKQYAELCEPGGTRFLAFNVDPAFSSCIDGLVLVDLQRLKAAKRERYLNPGGAVPEPAEGMLKSA